MATDTGTTALFRERLRPPWWWYAVAIFVAVLLAAEFHIAQIDVTDWLPYIVLVPLAVGIVFSMGQATVVVDDTTLRVRGATLPLDIVSGIVALDDRTLRRVVGREGDPAAFVAIRPWIGPGAQLWLDDPDDPTPYWVVSTRRPQQLVELIRARGQ
ncbi:MAG: DUF3093 domain-containing protein [Jatrophihabitans sp.]|uniref:DUF3093 domain-containing protein n=1 Tax=Jatrophihabitans sp. TaxID=1932789 RepID=UPI003F7F65B0